MKRLFAASLGGVVALFLTGTPAAIADNYPDKPITMTITFKAGGAADIAGRLAAKAAERLLGQPITVINKLGGGGATGFDFVGKQAPDGYNVGWLSASILTTTILGNLPYGYDHFEYVCGVTFDATALAVKADAPWKTLPEFLAAAKKTPKQVKVGHAGTGSFTYMTAAALMAQQKADVTFVPVGARRLPALLAGEVEAISVHPPELLAAMKGGKVRLLAISSPKRVDAYPEVPTFGEIGMELGFYQFRGIFVPKGTPQAVKARLSQAFKASATDPKLLEVAKEHGFGINFIGLDEFPAYVKRQNELLREVIERTKKKS
ncbi:tripartite tricarboxylate transporter substrate binding protein [Candidatus Uhrbacteria bacterium]|nr:tripartite tricarboxylate transporter substrate binding protein [Candidatus Uhrbacteria bacterium]